jgi:hypothetical protein
MVCAGRIPPNGFPHVFNEDMSLRVWLPVCTNSLLLSHLNRIRRGKGERCGTSAIGSSSLTKRSSVGSGILPLGQWLPLAQTVSCRWSGSVSRNSTTPGLIPESLNAWACLWTPHASERTARTFWHCAPLYAWPGGRTEGQRSGRRLCRALGSNILFKIGVKQSTFASVSSVSPPGPGLPPPDEPRVTFVQLILYQWGYECVSLNAAELSVESPRCEQSHQRCLIRLGIT